MSLLLLFNKVSDVTAFLRTDADDTNTDNWVDQAGSSTGIFNAIDEASVDDADYILSPFRGDGVGTVVRFRLSNPAAGKTLVGPVKVRYRFKKTGTATRSLIVRLKQGTTQVAVWTHFDTDLIPTTTGWQTAEQTLSSGQLAAITDFDNLFVQFDDLAA